MNTDYCYQWVIPLNYDFYDHTQQFIVIFHFHLQLEGSETFLNSINVPNGLTISIMTFEAICTGLLSKAHLADKSKNLGGYKVY